MPNALTTHAAPLQPFAVPHEGVLGRGTEEPGDPLRSPFQRDRGRIIHTQAFRRLQGKTQVFVAGEGDHFRTRLTHTMEVAQIGRDIARRLGLNEDLTECIALAHDLGHPPFGHRGEWALDAWMRERGAHFEHNEQSVRIVTLLETHSPLAPGLNLNREVIEGMQKHREALELPAPAFPRSLSLEAQIVNCADEIAYMGHDFDDGLRAGFFSLAEAMDVPLIARAAEVSAARHTELRGAIIHLLATDLHEHTERLLEEHHISTLDAVYACAEPLAVFSPAMQRDLAPLRDFLRARMYEHPHVVAAGTEGQEIIRALCDAYEELPPPKVTHLMEQTKGTIIDAVKDYVAGMTDGFARSQSETL